MKILSDVLRDEKRVTLRSTSEMIHSKYCDKLAKKRFKNWIQYYNELAKKRGFKNFNEYLKRIM